MSAEIRLNLDDLLLIADKHY